MKTHFVASIVFLTGCATTTAVAPIGDGKFTVASQGVIGNGSGAAQKVAALEAANAYCAARGEKIEVTLSGQSEPMFGRAPSGWVEFRCEK